MRAFEEEGKKTNRPRLLLTAAVSARKETIDSAYQIAQIGAWTHYIPPHLSSRTQPLLNISTCVCLFVSVLDYIHVMTYDFHGLWEHNVGENSPLYKGPSDQGSMIYHNVVSEGVIIPRS